MSQSESSETIDLDLIDQIVNLIPTHTWEQVRAAIVTNIVDNMPGSVVANLTGDYDDFDKAEEILYSYYELPEKQSELILDGFRILGKEPTVYLLDSLQLNKIQSPTEITQDNEMC